MCDGQDATLLEQIEAIVGEPGAQIAYFSFSSYSFPLSLSFVAVVDCAIDCVGFEARG